jgi:hypothetical protein
MTGRTTYVGKREGVFINVVRAARGLRHIDGECQEKFDR